MKNFLPVYVILFVCFFVPRAVSAPPDPYIDKGACPFECCTYGTWKVEKTTTIYLLPDDKSSVVATLAVGSMVEAVTGEVHVKPARFTVKKPMQKYRPGDVLWVYTYLGEGFFKIWFKGKMYEEELGFSPYGGGAGKRCEKWDRCWGELDRELNFNWWIKVKMPKGKTGWTDQPDNFSGLNPCA